MRFVEKAVVNPARCAVLPFIGGNHVDGYIDSGSEVPGRGDQWDQHVYVSIVAVRQMATMIGWSSPGDIEALKSQHAELQLELDAAREDLANAELILDSIDALESADFRARKKAGRPPKPSEPERKRGPFKKKPVKDPDLVEELV